MSTEPRDDDGTHIEADLYYFKFSTTLKPGADEADPENWKDVAKQINRHVMRIVRDLFGLVSDFTGAVRRRLRPATKPATPDRGDAARRLADERELPRHESVGVAAANQRALTLEALRDAANATCVVQGIPVQLFDRGDGTFGITMVTPECQAAAGEIALKKQPELKRVTSTVSIPVEAGQPDTQLPAD